jgi:phosphoglycerate dehydrogenase-like enzyme
MNGGKVVVAVEEIPEDLKSYLLQKYEFIDLSVYLKDYKRINNYERNDRERWNSILKKLPEFKKPSVVIFRTYLILDSYLLSLFPDKILYLRAGSGYDNIDIDYAFLHGSFIENTPAANTNAAVEHSIALLFASIKKINIFNSSIRAGLWRDDISLNREISGKNILIIGFGNIGSEVASIVKSLGGNVFIYDPYKSIAGSLDNLAGSFNNFREKIKKNLLWT